METLTGTGDARDFRVGIVVSTYHDFVTNRLRDGAIDALRAAGVADDAIVVATVPGAFEIPQAARRLAERMMTEGGVAPEDRIAYAYRLATAHGPGREAQTILVDGFQHHLDRYQADRAAAVALVSQGAHPRDETLDVAQLASYTMVANLILNLDGTITKE